MNRVRWILLLFCVFLGLVIYAADTGEMTRHGGSLPQIPMGDKVGHCGLMMTLCLLVNLSMDGRPIRRGGKPFLLLGTVIVAVLVVAEEVSQIWIPSRSFDLLDLSADGVGILLADLLARRLRRSSPAPSDERGEFPVVGRESEGGEIEGDEGRPTGERAMVV